MRLLTRAESSAKIAHGDLNRYEAAILYLAPHTVASEDGLRNVCSYSTPGCRASCLFTAGRAAGDPRINRARIRRTNLLFGLSDAFRRQLDSELRNLKHRAARKGKRPVARLDGTSDLGLALWFANVHPEILFYDYTKNPLRMLSYLAGDKPKNWRLTFSRSESNEDACKQVLSLGGNVTVVFKVGRGKPLPKRWWGYRVIDGDRSDFRFDDRGKSLVIGLRAKGRARRDTTGFAVDISHEAARW